MAERLRNAGKAWGAYEDETIRHMLLEGHDSQAVAEALGRTRFGVEQRIVKLGAYTDAEIRAWAERHDIAGSRSARELRMIFGDARSLVSIYAGSERA